MSYLLGSLKRICILCRGDHRTGFRGGLNCIEYQQDPRHHRSFPGSTIEQPSIYGRLHDLIAGNTPEAIGAMQNALGDLRHCEIIDGAGHWLQQECASEVNTALLAFLEGLD